ncbi:MAG: lytic transglycosylase domain-containing protein [Pseudomonadales bacterium]
MRTEHDFRRYAAHLVRSGTEGMRSSWQAVPRMFRILVTCHLAFVFALAAIASVVSFNGTHAGYQRLAFALPAVEHTSVPWHSEVDAFGHKVSQAFGVHRTTATEFAGWILEASERQGIEPELLASLVLTESSFKKDARSHLGAIGPAQVRPEFWSTFCGGDLQDPADNIYCGAQVLSHLLDRCGDDTGCALTAYNIGPYGSEKQAGRRYVSKVDEYTETLRKYPL